MSLLIWDHFEVFYSVSQENVWELWEFGLNSYPCLSKQPPFSVVCSHHQTTQTIFLYVILFSLLEGQADGSSK